MIKTLKNFDDYINQALADWHIPGAAVAVVKGDKVLHSGGYGLRDRQQGLPVTENTRFPIASMTKPFTAMGAAILVDDGLLDWDQPVRDVLPEFRLYDDYATQHATLRDLLSHRTGLPRHDSTWHGTSKTREEIFEGLRHLKPNADFRSLWQYNNLMFETTGLLCQRVTGSDSWDDFIQTRILDPLNLKSTTPRGPAVQGAEFTDVALSYQLKNGESTPRPFPITPSLMGPAGSMHSTLNDMVAWLKVHTNEGKSNGVQLVSPYNLQQMHTPHMLIPATVPQTQMFNNCLFAYGLGWFIEPYQGVTLIHHGGNIDGYSLMAAFVPQEQLAVVVLTNIQGKSLRGALLYEAIDRALEVDSASTKDWSAELLKTNETAVQSALASQGSSDADRVKNAPASHALANYAGVYAAPVYADIEVRMEGDGLRIHHAGEWFDLLHYHFDVFEIDMTERYDGKEKISFRLNNQGDIDCLQIAIEPAIGEMSFKRQGLTVNPEILQTLVGLYDFPAEGQNVEVSIKDDTLHLGLTGSAAKSLSCVKQAQTSTGSTLTFKSEGQGQGVIEFRLHNGQCQIIVIKQPGVTYECKPLA